MKQEASHEVADNDARRARRESDESIREAADDGRARRRALPFGDQDRLVGIITDRDIAIRAVAEGRSRHRIPTS